jgi:hypothetical protein
MNSSLERSGHSFKGNFNLEKSYWGNRSFDFQSKTDFRGVFLQNVHCWLKLGFLGIFSSWPICKSSAHKMTSGTKKLQNRLLDLNRNENQNTFCHQRLTLPGMSGYDTVCPCWPIKSRNRPYSPTSPREGSVIHLVLSHPSFHCPGDK